MEAVEQAPVCTSCKRKAANLPGTTSFSCPECDGALIVRCGRCREKAVQYTCPSCGFTGPN